MDGLLPSNREVALGYLFQVCTVLYVVYQDECRVAVVVVVVVIVGLAAVVSSPSHHKHHHHPHNPLHHQANGKDIDPHIHINTHTLLYDQIADTAKSSCACVV